MANSADGQRLNVLVKRLGLEQYTVLPGDGTPITRFEHLARLIWNLALGYTEKDVKSGKEIIHKPDKSFIRMIYDRMEGKVPNAQVSSDKKASLADKISDQTKSRLNSLADDNG